jgi:tRNA(Arg) A34 adenosine deaminase TadA
MSKKLDKRMMKRAVKLADRAQEAGEAPIGAVLELNGNVLTESMDRSVETGETNHAVIGALRNLEYSNRQNHGDVACYVTREPCPMCASALLLAGIGRVVFGRADKTNGAGQILDELKTKTDQDIRWEGPQIEAGDRSTPGPADELFSQTPLGRQPDIDSFSTEAPSDHLETLETWDQDPGEVNINEVRESMDQYVEKTSEDHVEEILPYAKSVFEETGYLKDFKRYRNYADRVGYIDIFEESGRAIRRHLPDIWIKDAIRRGHIEPAIDCWYEHEEHRRIRHCSDKLVEAVEEDRPELVISCRLSVVEYYIGRKARRHYQSACNVLRRLRDELESAGHNDYWQFVLKDLQMQYSHLPALMDELKKAGFVSSD